MDRSPQEEIVVAGFCINTHAYYYLFSTIAGQQLPKISNATEKTCGVKNSPGIARLRNNGGM